MKALSVACTLLLQKPHLSSKPKDFTSCLSRGINRWKEGKIEELLLEGCSIPQRLLNIRSSVTQEFKLAHSFSNLMLKGKTKAPVHLITENNKGWILLPGDSAHPENPDSPIVLESLRSKHPPAQPCASGAIASPSCPSLTIHLVVFEGPDVQCIQSAALRTTGASGASGTDAHC